MAVYNHKDRRQLAIDASKKRLRNEGRILLDELLNEALAKYADEVKATPNAVNEIRDLDGVRRYLRNAAREVELFEGLTDDAPVVRAG